MALVKLYAARDTLEAGHIRLWLGQHDMDSTVLGEHLSAARGELPLTVDTLPAVWVDDHDSARAMVLMKNYFEQKQNHANLPSWQCSACGENIEGQFDTCWNCEATRPADPNEPA